MPYCHDPAQPESCGICFRASTDPIFAITISHIRPPRTAPLRRGNGRILKAPVTARERPDLFDCLHRGGRTGENRECRSGCKKGTLIPLQSCSIHGKCSVAMKVDNSPCCKECPDRNMVMVREPLPIQNKVQSKRAIVTASSGEEGEETLAISIKWIEAYARRLDADLVILRDTLVPNWGMSVKFGIGAVLDAYERIIYLDADTTAHPLKCPDLFQEVPDGYLGICDDYKDMIRTGFGDQIKREYALVCQSQGWPVTDFDWYGNTGVMVIEKSHRDLFRVPEKPLRACHLGEQHVWLARMHLSKTRIHFMPSQCNYQWWSKGNFQSDPPTNAILHYSGMRPHKSFKERIELMKNFAHT